MQGAFLYIRDTNKGKGVFAGKAFQRGESIFKFGGKFFVREQLPKTYHCADHYMQIGKNLYLGPSGKFDDFFNHSCDPNAGLKFNVGGIALVAIKNIDIDEEITWDYSTTMDENDWEMCCKCGNFDCRGIIRDFKYLPHNLQRKYLNLAIVPNYIVKKFKCLLRQ